MEILTTARELATLNQESRINMKNPLQNLLIFFAMCLCALCAYQWHVQKNLQEDVQIRQNTIQDKLQAIQGLEGVVKNNNEEIKRLDGLKNQLTEIVKSNRAEIAQLTKDLDKSNQEVDRQTKQVDVYKDALEKANDSILKQNEEVKKQNDELKKLSEDRNDIAAKYNKVVTEFNELAQMWNALQSTATNAPPAKK
jgi:chromosome segregation ATPase